MIDKDNSNDIINGVDDAISKLYSSIESNFDMYRALDIRKNAAENAMIKMNKRMKKMKMRLDAQDLRQTENEKRLTKKEKTEMYRFWLSIVFAAAALVVAIAALALQTPETEQAPVPKDPTVSATRAAFYGMA